MNHPPSSSAKPAVAFKSKALIVGTLVLAAGWIAYAQAPAGVIPAGAPARIAVVDVSKVLTTSTPGKAAYDKLKKMQDEQVAKNQTLAAEVRQLDADITAKKVTQDKLPEAQKQLAEKRLLLQTQTAEAERTIGEARERELMALENRIKPIIDNAAKESGYTLIFNKFESGLIYASDSVDITDSVIQRFNGTTQARN